MKSGLLKLQNSEFFLDIAFSGLKRPLPWLNPSASLLRRYRLWSSVTSLWSWLLDRRTLEKNNTSRHSLLQQVLLSPLIVPGLLVYPGLSGLSPALLGTPRGGPFPESGYSVLQVRRAASKDSNSVTCKSMSHELRMKR